MINKDCITCQKIFSARPTGQWIIHLYEFGKDRYECDSCHERCDTEYCYCPNCGRKMEGWKWG